LRPPRTDIAAPPFPPGTEWVGEPPRFERALAAGPALVHFFDFAQLNSVRALPYLVAWRKRYREAGLTVLGVHAPRFPFTRSATAAAAALPTLAIDWPVALDPGMRIWREYEPHGWPALFLWGRGGALRWYHLGEGDYQATEEAIREALRNAAPNGHDWPPLLEPLRPSDAPGATVVAPTPEFFPGGAPEQPWRLEAEAERVELEYEAGGAYVAADGSGEIAVRIDGEPLGRVPIEQPGLHELVSHHHSERHTIALEPSTGLSVYSLQFAAGVPG
jgi:Thioredoxin like C-terminal domain